MSLILLATDVLSLCAEVEPSQSVGKDGGSSLQPQEIALSLLTVEGYDGQNSCVSLLACLAVI